MNLMQMGLASQALTVEANKVEVLRQMIAAHDLTYSDSDDGSVWRRGTEHLDAILKYVDSNSIDRKTFADIWNENVDKKIGVDFRVGYYMAVKYE